MRAQGLVNEILRFEYSREGEETKREWEARGWEEVPINMTEGGTYESKIGEHEMQGEDRPPGETRPPGEFGALSALGENRPAGR